MPTRIERDEVRLLLEEARAQLVDVLSAKEFENSHIAGAISLPFTDFTAESLAKVIPSPSTRVLIYCNNNFAGDEVAMPSKSAPASLNISTYIGLATYGYTNVWELGPLLDVGTSKLAFAGTHVSG